ncbi:insulin-like receptor [Leptopilina boulardi]|uniref:insulin-like receptor n=1 Tax=Leptopilina boulardi TaxID=63433 RepID=UPI0021F5F99F|nr:insulin-like receptor [Leptopilina boulardi]XP_051164842.1 insulin-like receptor [Leptopilina boulardi]XP_051164843.1 insulin-like receptor [Leptopilina boulardi]
MKTKKQLFIVLCVLLTSCVISVENLPDKSEFKPLTNKDISLSKENGDLDFSNELKNAFHDFNERDDKIRDKDNFNKGTLIYRYRRAIDSSSSLESSVGKHGQQTVSEKQHKKNSISKERTRDKSHRSFPNVTSVDGICPSIDIRNNVSYFKILKDCQVIEGFLQIVLIERFNETDFQKYEFTKLREITGYLLLYRVNGLKSLSKLFPNLEVIRGDTLLTDYAFMIYEMQNLQEIGLKKLTRISRGAVRIEKNPSLCYTTTLDWNAIVVAGENTIKDNMNESSCPGCSQCPGGHCWATQLCQETQKPEKCHPQCLGDCKGTTDSDCYVCKHYRHKGKCIEKCPPDLYSYLSRRCITKSECYQISKSRKSYEENFHKWRPFQQSCIMQCPDGYEDYIDEHNVTSCRDCEGRCRRVISGAIIHHISDAQIFRGISVVNGALEFQIRSGSPNIMNELAVAFGQIEEITGYLKITHSFHITNLGFFKKLKIIKGEILDINNSSLVILDNPNLSDLFNKNQQLKILNGKLFFHYNSKLCLQKIYDLSKMLGMPEPSDLEVQPISNGDKVACEIVAINMTVGKLGSDYAVLQWNSYTPHANQLLLSYLLNYIETDINNVTYEGNSCSNNTWQIKDVENPNINSSKESIVSKPITNLKPYTKYAVYVKTFTARRKDKEYSSVVGQSKIIYFRTKSDVPSIPTNVVTNSLSSSEILITWNPPIETNGPIGYYIISGFMRPDNDELALERNYCENGLIDNDNDEMEESPEIMFKTIVTDSSTSCCSKGNEKIVQSKKFEIFCQGATIINHWSPGRKNYCRSNEQGLTSGYHDNSFIFNITAENNSHKLTKLQHFTVYTISIAACGEIGKNEMPMCSQTVYSTIRTNSTKYFDNVRNVRAHERNHANSSSVIVYWEPAENPNGIIVSYIIEYINIDVKDAKKVSECVNIKNYREKRGAYEIKDLSPGRYNFRVRSTSLAGNSEFSNAIQVSVGLKENNSLTIAIVLPLALFFAVTVFIYLLFRSHQKKRSQERLFASVNPDYMETKYIVDEWEIERSRLVVGPELGLGNFGMVCSGKLDGDVDVAIKTIPKTANDREKNEFLNEASVMKNFSSYHIVKLLGVISVGMPTYVVMELMHNGDLKLYLRGIRDTPAVPDTPQMIRMAAEIADGMAYLESKKFVHRDLAARNCMISKKLVCKVGDFGMARDIYETDYYKIGQKGLLPVRWMAPENLSDGVFTSDSDVWSFGVVLYEIVTLAELPYQGYSNEDVLDFVLRKGTLSIPRYCPDSVKKLIEKCFKWKPSERPTFMEIVGELESLLSQDFCENSFYHSEEGVEIRKLGIKKVYQPSAPVRFHWGNETARWIKEFEDNVTLLDQSTSSRGRIFKNGFQHFGNVTNLEDVPLDR